jgi:hypothetical protein
MVIWSSNGDINAGKGAKTIADVPRRNMSATTITTTRSMHAAK